MSVLWGKGRSLDYWAAIRRDDVSMPEKRAMSLLASLSDERRFSFYCMSGMFPAMGNVTKRIYFVRRWTTVLELEDGRPRASWCILAKDRNIAPETDHVVAMKNLIEGSELAFREVANPFHYSHDPFRGQVDPKTSFPNPYHNSICPDAGLPVFQEEDATVEFKKRKIEAECLAGRAEREWNERLEAAKKWTRIPEKPKYQLPSTDFERLTGRMQQGAININRYFMAGATTATTFDTNVTTGWTINSTLA